VQQETAERIKDVMSVDPISEFEVRSGKDYKTNSELENLAMMFFAMEHGALKTESLKNQRDTYHGMPVEEYIAAITDFGFTQILCDKFSSEKWGYEEKYLMFWHPKGLLLAFETFHSRSVNGGKVYYNWKSETENRFRYTSSGCYRDGVWVGDHDCREGLIANMTAMDSVGEFLPVWWQSPHLWLLTYADWDKCRETVGYHAHDAITANRISRLPQHVQDAIRGVKE
jgi:hypothetical protein